MSEQPQLDERVKGHTGYGLIQLVTGNGKGKTTSTIGQAIRTVGAGKRAAFVFFDKGGDHYMERNVFDEYFNGKIDWWAFGRDRINPVSGRFDFSVTEEDKKLGENGLEKVRELFALGSYDLVVLDEVNSSTDLGFLDEQAVLDLLDEKPDHVEVILTGRNAPNSFKHKAHLVTNAMLEKHYFYSGVKAREGLDF